MTIFLLLTKVLTVVVDKGRVVIECVVGGVVVVVVVDDNAGFQILNCQKFTSISVKQY
jgi:hypothetical protein